MNRDDGHNGWYYKQDGKTLGPVSLVELKELMESGRIPARQAVWKRERGGVLFVTAAKAIKETKLTHP